jgi:putative zinc finger/helix-turn-helix YgiT family protein
MAPRSKRLPAGLKIPCPECGDRLKTSREPHRYTITASWAITLENVEFHRCTTCGYFEVSIDRSEALHRTIAAVVIRKSARLSGSELTFLRRQLDLNGRELAQVLGVRSESVSRWERGREPIGPTVDRLVRALVALKLGGDEPFPVEVLGGIAGDAEPLRLVITTSPKGEWKQKAA